MELKIAVITPLYYPSIGGIPASMHCFARFFASQDVLVNVYTTQLRKLDEISYKSARLIRNFEPEETFENVKIHRFETGGTLHAFLGLLYAGAYHLHLPFWRDLYHLYRMRGIRAQKLIRAVAEFTPDVILAGPLTSNIFDTALRAKHSCGAKLIVKTAIHPEEPDPGQPLLHHLAEADLFLVNTPVEQILLEKNGVEPEKIRVLGPTFDVTSVLAPKGAADPALVDKIKNRRFALYLGRIEKGKGVPELIKAMDLVRQSCPDACLVLAGGPTKYFEKNIRSQIKNDPAVFFAGEVTEGTKHWLLEHAAAYSMVSKVDSFGIVYLEAWLHKKPVIGADLDAMRSVIDHEKNGVLVPYGDINKLADALIGLLADPEKSAKLGEAGYEKVIRNFSDHAVEKKLLGLIQELCAKDPL